MVEVAVGRSASDSRQRAAGATAYVAQDQAHAMIEAARAKAPGACQGQLTSGIHLAAIDERRRRAIRRLALDINLDVPVEVEKDKFDWLLENGVITEAEHREKLKALGGLDTDEGRPRRLH